MKKSAKFIVAILFATLLTVGAVFLIAPSKEAHGYTGVVGAPTGIALLSATNTYDHYSSFGSDSSSYTGGNYEANTYTSARKIDYNNLASPNGNQVMQSAPQITVLTHGLGGSASHWSNVKDPNPNEAVRKKEGLFAYDSESLISKLSGNGTLANVYWAKVMSNNFQDFNLYDITGKTGTYDDQNFMNNNSVNAINTSKHIIIVFEAHYDTKPNDDTYLIDSHERIYYQFNFMLSKIVYDVSRSNENNKLPKVNLIGHSRGGLTNLMYALDHPDLVENMISIDTPYIGSTTASANKEINYF